MSAPILEVSLAAIAANTRHFVASTDAEVMAVVKADAFGHGASDVAFTAIAAGATWLGVTSVEEGLELRAAGVVAPMLSWLNGIDAPWELADAAGIDVAVSSPEQAMAIAAEAPGSRVHAFADTGMSREGASDDQWRELVEVLAELERSGDLRVVGIMGHLACADAPAHPANAAGRAAFAAALADARAAGLRPMLRHLAATSASLADRSSHLDLVRIGAGLVGIDATRSGRLTPAMTLRAPVIGVHAARAGTPVGYGHTAVCERDTHLALLPVGYADGVPAAAAGRAEVSLRGRRCRVIGRVSMDSIVVDVGDDVPALGEWATIFGPGSGGEPTAADWAAWAGTIEHEIVTGIGRRVQRRVVAATPAVAAEPAEPAAPVEPATPAATIAASAAPVPA